MINVVIRYLRALGSKTWVHVDKLLLLLSPYGGKPDVRCKLKLEFERMVGWCEHRTSWDVKVAYKRFRVLLEFSMESLKNDPYTYRLQWMKNMAGYSKSSPKTIFSRCNFYDHDVFLYLWLLWLLLTFMAFWHVYI